MSVSWMGKGIHRWCLWWDVDGRLLLIEIVLVWWCGWGGGRELDRGLICGSIGWAARDRWVVWRYGWWVGWARIHWMLVLLVLLMLRCRLLWGLCVERRCFARMLKSHLVLLFLLASLSWVWKLLRGQYLSLWSWKRRKLLLLGWVLILLLWCLLWRWWRGRKGLVLGQVWLLFLLFLMVRVVWMMLS